MCFANVAGKKLSPVNSRYQIAQGVDYRRRIVAVNKKHFESTIVENDVQFAVPPAEMAFLKNVDTRS